MQNCGVEKLKTQSTITIALFLGKLSRGSGRTYTEGILCHLEDMNPLSLCGKLVLCWFSELLLKYTPSSGLLTKRSVRAICIRKINQPAVNLTAASQPPPLRLSTLSCPSDKFMPDRLGALLLRCFLLPTGPAGTGRPSTARGTPALVCG